MIHSVKDLSPDQKLAIESLLGLPFPKESKSACALCPLRRNGLRPSKRTPGKKAPINSRWKKLTRKLPQHGVSAASAPDNDSGCHRCQRSSFSIIDQRRLPEAVIDLAIPGEVQWFASGSVLAEYEDALKRPRLAIDSGKAADAMARIRPIVSVVSPAASVAAASDPDDNQFLECAEDTQAHYLVTGNIRHFPEVWKETRIVTPREFIDAWTAVPSVWSSRSPAGTCS